MFRCVSMKCTNFELCRYVTLNLRKPSKLCEGLAWYVWFPQRERRCIFHVKCARNRSISGLHTDGLSRDKNAKNTPLRSLRMRPGPGPHIFTVTSAGVYPELVFGEFSFLLPSFPPQCQGDQVQGSVPGPSIIKIMHIDVCIFFYQLSGSQDGTVWNVHQYFCLMLTHFSWLQLCRTLQHVFLKVLF